MKKKLSKRWKRPDFGDLLQPSFVYHPNAKWQTPPQSATEAAIAKEAAVEAALRNVTIYGNSMMYPQYNVESQRWSREEYPYQKHQKNAIALGRWLRYKR